MDKIEINKSNPFEWGVVEEKKYVSIPTQRNATYTKPMENDYTPNELNVFMYNEQAPTPPLAYVCGIECPEGDDSGDNGGETGGDGNNNGNNG